jgi:hypothetical protein
VTIEAVPQNVAATSPPPSNAESFNAASAPTPREIIDIKYIEFWTRDEATKKKKPAKTKGKGKKKQPVENPEPDSGEDEVRFRPDRLFSKGPSVSTGSPAKISFKAYGRLCMLYNAVSAQNPDFGEMLHMIRDEEGYNVMEVIHGQLWEYERAIGKKKEPVDALRNLWPIVEGMAFFFLGGEDIHWMSKFLRRCFRSIVADRGMERR